MYVQHINIAHFTAQLSKCAARRSANCTVQCKPTVTGEALEWALGDLRDFCPVITPSYSPYGVRLFARRTFTTPKIRTFTTPKFGHFPPPKKNICQEDNCHPQFFSSFFGLFFLAFLTYSSWRTSRMGRRRCLMRWSWSLKNAKAPRALTCWGGLGGGQGSGA